MNTFIALLRGINVSGQKKILMADLRELLTAMGFGEVRSYIQSGNLVFTSDGTQRQIEAKIKEGIHEHYGWEVPVLVRTSDEIAQALHNCPFAEEKMKKSYFTLFQERPEDDLMSTFREMSFPREEFVIDPNCLYYYCEAGYGKAKMTNKLIEQKLKTRVTTRNYNTLTKLVELAG